MPAAYESRHLNYKRVFEGDAFSDIDKEGDTRDSQ
jgi:hypothetical protein